MQDIYEVSQNDVNVDYTHYHLFYEFIDTDLNIFSEYFASSLQAAFTTAPSGDDIHYYDVDVEYTSKNLHKI